MDTIVLSEEYRLIERSESEVNTAWKGAHLLLFFLAFVFGSFCTFCFHMLMYLFDEKCVLFPKLLSLTSLRQNIIYEFIPEDKEIADMLPVDFLSTQWVDKSACYLPTYVPLVSGIFGLVWTTMFLMCSTGSRTLTGLQRPWRVLLPVFVFSLAMGGLCLYATIVTDEGLQDLCIKLGEITGSSTCTYSVNVATLAYERRIRGVYQAIRITIISAWLHTLCWLLSALLTLIRVLLVVDFQLIRVTVLLKGNIDKMLFEECECRRASDVHQRTVDAKFHRRFDPLLWNLANVAALRVRRFSERHEKQIRTVSPDTWINNGHSPRSPLGSHSQINLKVHFQKREQESRQVDTSSLNADDTQSLSNDEGQFIFKSNILVARSEPALVSSERLKLERLQGYDLIPEDKRFIVKMIDDLIDSIDICDVSILMESRPLIRQYGQQHIASSHHGEEISETAVDPKKAEELLLDIKRKLEKKIKKRLSELQEDASTSKRYMEFESHMNITSEMRRTLEEKRRESSKKNQSEVKPKFKKSNLKNKKIQTDETAKKWPSQKVQIVDKSSSENMSDEKKTE